MARLPAASGGSYSPNNLEQTTMRRAPWFLLGGVMTLPLLLSLATPDDDQITRHRNLGKAFYENPTTQTQAVDEFKKALDLNAQSAPERLNYALALLRAGKTAEGIAQLEIVQKQDPALPHTWFNLGIQFKKEGNHKRALQQFQRMVTLVPNEPISQYNLGLLYKLTGQPDLSLKHFEISAKLDQNLAGPRFQLYNAYRAAGREEEANRFLQSFQEIKKSQIGAVIPEDLDWSSYAEIYDVVDPRHVSRPAEPVGPRFKPVDLSGKSTAEGPGLTLLKFDADAIPDVISWSSEGIKVYRSGSGPVALPGLADLTAVKFVAAGDFNNDGLSDLCVLTNTAAALYQNQKTSFEKVVDLAGGNFSSAVWLDYDHDYDLDLFLLGEKSMLHRNNGAAGFSDRTSGFPFVAGRALDGAMFDLVKDTNGIDLVVSYQDKPGILYRDLLAGKFEAVALPALPPGSRRLSACDINNDGWTDLLASGSAGASILANREGKLEKSRTEFSGSGAVALADLENRGYADLILGKSVYSNLGLENFAAAKELPGTSDLVAVVSADFNADGKADLAAINGEGATYLFQNVTESKNRWVAVNLEGVKNLRLAPGAEVEAKSGSLYQKRTYHGIPLVFGLESGAVIETLRITWPNGLIQNEIKPALDRIQTYKEKQRLSGSCPMVYTWNGRGFEFITDVLGVAPLGASSGDGQFFPVDHDEYVQIPGRSLSVTDGRCEIRITEELREVAYIDKIALLAVDHPEDTDVFTSDKFKAPPFPEFRLFGVKQRIYPKGAWDDDGNDVREKLLRRDRNYPSGFKRDYSGTAEKHHLVLDFGPAAQQNKSILVLNGWVDWADGSTFAKVSQERRGGLVMPFLQVKDQAGRWTTVIEDMGIPAGKPKTIVVDLTGKFLSRSRQVRIVTDLCLYWDEIFLSEDPAPPAVTITKAKQDSAQLRFRGFSTPVIHPERKQPEMFIYSRWSPVSMWNPTPGRYTRYGDVNELLQAPDDRFAIMGSGDELRLTFSVQNLPLLADGYKRDYLLMVDGWAKDADLNTAFSQSVEPLPFHGMSSYPYPAGEKFPDDRLHQQYRDSYNTRPALRLLRPLRESGASGTTRALKP